MTSPAPVLCSAIALPDTGVPEWVHLLPAGVARTVDGRGPYRIPDAAALMAASLAAGHKLAVDENHSTDIAAPQGKPSPARGWIVELQSRVDGIWGKVDWTGPGRRMMEDREYRGLSPVITHDRAGTVTGILRASLTNVPNLAGLVALHHQENEDMALRDTLIGALGLDGGADDAAIVAAVTAAKDGGGQVALQSALAPIAKVAGLPETADAASVLAGVQQLAGASDDRVTALQASLTTATAQIKTLTDDRARDKATAFVDGAIKAGRVGLTRDVRENYISMHMRDSAEAEKLVNAMPILVPGQLPAPTLPSSEGSPDSPALLAQKATAYQSKLAASGVTISYPAAVRAVAEGKTA